MDPLAYTKLRSQLEELSQLNSTIALLHWDQAVHMPEKGGNARSQLIGQLSLFLHEKFLQLDKNKLLTNLHRWAERHRGTPESIVIHETWRTYQRERKLPKEFVQELSELGSKGQAVWTEARAKSDFGLFLPTLKRLVELKQQEAELVGYVDSPYDALLDVYEPGLTSAHVSVVFSELREFLKPFIRKIQKSPLQAPAHKLVLGKFPQVEQEQLNRAIAKKIGFDFDAGRLDRSTHPFTTSFHPEDVRITTRYNERDVLYALGSTIHEVGHALYEQGLPIEHFGSPLAEAISLGIHESQSRIWENNVGKSKAFWKYFYPKLQRQFPRPFARIPLETFYRLLNDVRPSLIRTESDEVTYNLHIILRYEIERDLIEGTINVKDLPQIWNAKMKEYLGVKVPSDREGVLQDMHWSDGSFGYFPTYTLGNLYAAQFFHAASQQIPRLTRLFEKGSFSPLREWLRHKIHAHGKIFTSEALVKEVTGEPLQASYFIAYLKEKYGELYKL